MAHKGYTKGHRVTQVIKDGGEVTPSAMSDYSLSDFLFSVEDSSCTVPVRAVPEGAECGFESTSLGRHKPRHTDTHTQPGVVWLRKQDH